MELPVRRSVLNQPMRAGNAAFSARPSAEACHDAADSTVGTHRSIGARDTASHIPVDAAHLAGMSTRELRLLCNRTYKALDTDYPPFETVGLYQELVEVLEQRESEALSRTRSEAARERFRDNQWASTFELIRNGIVAGYIKYRIDGGDLTLLHLVVDPQFTDVGVEASLVRHTLLDLHRRRLSVTSLCPEISAFIVDHPEFAALLPIRHRHNDARVIPLIRT